MKLQQTLKTLCLPVVACAVFSAIPAYAAIFTAKYTGTVSGNNGVDNVNVGDSAVITYQLDNGGTSALNQTWTASNLKSVTFNFGNGAHVTTFDPNGVGGNGLSGTAGNFVTNGLGQLTAVPLSWADISNVNVISTNSTQTPNGWSVSGANSVYVTNNFQFGVDLANVVGTNDPANWIIVEAQPQATPEPGPLLGLLTVGLGGVFLKGRNAS